MSMPIARVMEGRRACGLGGVVRVGSHREVVVGVSSDCFHGFASLWRVPWRNRARRSQIYTYPRDQASPTRIIKQSDFPPLLPVSFGHVFPLRHFFRAVGILAIVIGSGSRGGPISADEVEFRAECIRDLRNHLFLPFFDVVFFCDLALSWDGLC